MRIALVVPGGVARDGEHRVIPAILWLVERLAQRHDVHVIVPRQEARPAAWELLGAEVHNLGAGRAWQPRAVRTLVRLHRQEPFHVFHALWARGPGEVAWAAARLCGRPVLVHVAGGELVWLPEVAFGARRAWRRRLARFVVRHADRATAASGPMLELVRETGARALRVPLGADTTRWTPEAPRPRPRDRPARLVQVGSLTPVKDHATLLRAVALLERDGYRVHVDLVGEDTWHGTVPRLARELGVDRSVTFHGFLPQRRAIPVVRAADLLVVTSRHEAGPVAMLEAAAVGVPTVGTPVGHVRDWAPDAAVAVPAGEPAALAREIAGLLAEDPRRLAIARRAQENALREDADWTCARFEELYAEVVGRASGAGPMPDLAARNRRLIDEWHRTGKLEALWPDVPLRERREAQAHVRAATASALAGSGERPRLAVEGEQQARALGIAAFLSGMGPLLGWWIEQGRVDASPEARDLLARHLDHGRRRGARLRAELARVARALRGEGVDPVVLKGLHTGSEYFPDPGTRPAADIDLLVRPDERPGAAGALAAAGFVEARRTAFAARWEWIPAGRPREVQSVEMDHVDNPWSVDLHTTLERWYFRGLRRGLGAEAGRATDRARIGEESFRVLAQPHLAGFLALHASYDLVKVQLVRVVELVLVLRRDLERGALDWKDLASLVQGNRTGRFVYPALALAEELAPGTVDRSFLAREARAATPRTRRVLAAVLAEDFGPLTHRSLDDKLMWARGPRELLLNVSDLLLPSDEGLPVGTARLYLRRLRTLGRGVRRWGGDRGERP